MTLVRRWRTGLAALLVLCGAAAAGAVAAHALTLSSPYGLPDAPQRLAFDPSAGRLYASGIGSSSVMVVTFDSAGAPSLTRTVSGVQAAFGLAVDPADRVLVAGSYSTGTVTFIDTGSESVVGTASVGSGSHELGGVAIDPTARTVWVSDFSTNAVYRFDEYTHVLLGHVLVGANPSGVAVDAQAHRLFVSNQGGDSVTVLDSRTGARLLPDLPLPPGSRPTGVVTDQGSGLAWVPESQKAAVAVIDPVAGRVTNRPTPVVAYQAAADPATHAAFFTPATGQDLLIVDGERMYVPQLSGTSFSGVAEDPATRRVFVATTSPAAIQVLTPAAGTTKVSTSSPSAEEGQAVTYTATVAPADTGSITFTDDGAAIPGCTAVPVPVDSTSAVATCQTDASGVGRRTIAASYTGGAIVTPSSGSLPGGETVTAAPAGALPATPVSPGRARVVGGAPAPPTTLAVPGSGHPVPVTAAAAAQPGSAKRTGGPASHPRGTPLAGQPGTSPAGAAATAGRPGPVAAPRAGDVAVRYIGGLPSPTAEGPVLAQIGEDLLLVLFLLALLHLPVALVNSTAEVNAAEITGWFTGLFRRARLTRRSDLPLPNSVTIVAAAGISGVLFALLRVGDGLSAAWLALMVGVAAALLILNLVRWWPQALVLRRNGVRVVAKLYPAFALVAAFSVLVSLATGLQPGLVLGPLMVLASDTEASPEREGRAGAIGIAVLGLASVGVWLARGSVLSLLGAPGSFPSEAIGVALTTVVIGGASAAVFDLLPLRFMTGWNVIRWSRAAWAALMVPMGLVFCHLVIGIPEEADHFARRGLYLAVLLGCYLLVALAFWGVFRRRSTHRRHPEVVDVVARSVTVDPVEQVTDECHNLAGVEESISGRTGMPQFRVGGKLFALIDREASLIVRLPVAERDRRIAAQPDRYFVPAYLGRGDWVGIRPEHADLDAVRGYIRDSYAAVAPKRLLSVTLAAGGNP